MRISSESLGATGEKIIGALYKANLLNGDHLGSPDLEIPGKCYIEVKTCVGWALNFSQGHTVIRRGYFFFSKAQHERMKGTLEPHYYALVVINGRHVAARLVPMSAMDCIVVRSGSSKPCATWKAFFSDDEIGRAPNEVREAARLRRENEQHVYTGGR